MSTKLILSLFGAGLLFFFWGRQLVRVAFLTPGWNAETYLLSGGIVLGLSLLCLIAVIVGALLKLKKK